MFLYMSMYVCIYVYNTLLLGCFAGVMLLRLENDRNAQACLRNAHARERGRALSLSDASLTSTWGGVAEALVTVRSEYVFIV